MTRNAAAAHAVKDELRGVVVFVVVIWTVFLLNWATGSWLPLERLALFPRRLSGMVGIATMPFLHNGWRHIVGNTFPLFVLLTLLAGSRARTWQIVTALVVSSGTLLWCFGVNEAPYVGASGLVFGLMGYLIASGFFERRPIPIVVALIVGFMYGGTLLWGVLPLQSGVAWDGHLYGVIAGVGVAYFWTGEAKATPQHAPTDRLGK